MPYPLENMHKCFFDWFDDKRKKDGLYYSVRKQRGNRLSHGYIFLGSDGYIGIPLVNHNDALNKTASVQFVYGADDNSYSIEAVSRNLANPKFKDSKEEKDFYEKVVAFIELMYKYAKENGGRILSPDESRMLFSSKHLLKPANVKESFFVAHQRYRPENNEYQVKLFFNESNTETALEKFYAFWKGCGVAYWSEYFSKPDDAIGRINRSLAKIDHSVAQCDWPMTVGKE